MADNDPRLDDILTIRAFCRRFPELGSEASLRWQVFNSSNNRLDEAGAIIRRGRNVFIAANRYRDWLLHQASGQKAA